MLRTATRQQEILPDLHSVCTPAFTPDINAALRHVIGPNKFNNPRQFPKLPVHTNEIPLRSGPSVQFARTHSSSRSRVERHQTVRQRPIAGRAIWLDGLDRTSLDLGRAPSYLVPEAPAVSVGIKPGQGETQQASASRYVAVDCGDHSPPSDTCQDSDGIESVSLVPALKATLSSVAAAQQGHAYDASLRPLQEHPSFNPIITRMPLSWDGCVWPSHAWAVRIRFGHPGVRFWYRGRLKNQSICFSLFTAANLDYLQ